MTSTAIAAAMLVTAYLTGAVPFGFLIGKMRGVDVRTLGSKNIGATNVYRTVGRKWGLLAFACDFLKGFVPVSVALWLVRSGATPEFPHLPLAAGLAAVVGHMFTCFMRFKGGKGVATGFGMLVALMPGLVLTAFAIFVAAVWISHYISLGSCLAAAFLAVAVWLPIPGAPGTTDLPLSITVAVIGAIIVWKHRTNIARLRAGTENKIW